MRKTERERHKKFRKRCRLRVETCRPARYNGSVFKVRAIGPGSCGNENIGGKKYENQIAFGSGGRKNIVLGVLLPSCDGVTVLETVRLGSCAVIATGAITEKRFASLALDAGAGYYMTEPFEPAVLDRRIKALRNAKPTPAYLDPSHAAAEQRISEIFMTVGIPAHIKGYQFLREAIKMAIDSPEIINSITKRLYPEVAEKFATSPSKVERAIRHAIEVAWNKGKIENINSLFGVKIYSSNEKPTNGEFIALVADKMLLESM